MLVHKRSLKKVINSHIVNHERAFLEVPLIIFFISNGVWADFSKYFHKYTAEWQSSNGVRQIFATPLGNVYKFQSISYDDIHDYLNINHTRYNLEKTVPSLQFELYKNAKQKKRLKRYIAIDIKLRVFPALSKKEDPCYHFNSFGTKIGAKNQIKLKNILYYGGMKQYYNRPLNYFMKFIAEDTVDSSNTKITGVKIAGEKVG